MAGAENARPTIDAWRTLDYHRLLDTLKEGQCWQFRLTANPVHSGRRKGWADTKPIAHVTVEHQQHWLTQRAERAGFQLISQPGPDSDQPDLTVSASTTRHFRRKNSTVTIATATYNGYLKITDTTALHHTLTRGIGRAKAYGCGLLTLAPIPR